MYICPFLRYFATHVDISNYVIYYIMRDAKPYCTFVDCNNTGPHPPTTLYILPNLIHNRVHLHTETSNGTIPFHKLLHMTIFLRIKA